MQVLLNRRVITQGIRSALRRAGLDLHEYRPDSWQVDPGFLENQALIGGRSLVDADRLYMLYQFANHTANLPGAYAELGVYRGGTAKLAAKTCPAKKIYLFDTFEGMPEVDHERDVHRAGDFRDTSLADVQEFLADCPNVEFRQGVFPHTAQGLEDECFSMAYIDADIYRSTKDALVFFYPRLTKGGVMVFDDYEWRRQA
jgi:O-methyltransferase